MHLKQVISPMFLVTSYTAFRQCYRTECSVTVVITQCVWSMIDSCCSLSVIDRCRLLSPVAYISPLPAAFIPIVRFRRCGGLTRGNVVTCGCLPNHSLCHSPPPGDSSPRERASDRSCRRGIKLLTVSVIYKTILSSEHPVVPSLRVLLCTCCF